MYFIFQKGGIRVLSILMWIKEHYNQQYFDLEISEKINF